MTVSSDLEQVTRAIYAADRTCVWAWDHSQARPDHANYYAMATAALNVLDGRKEVGTHGDKVYLAVSGRPRGRAPKEMTMSQDNRAIVVTFWTLRVTKVFNSLFPDLADNWIDDMREFYGEDAHDHTKTRLPMLTAPDWEHHPTT